MPRFELFCRNRFGVKDVRRAAHPARPAVLTLAVVALLAVLGSATPARAQLTNFYGPNLTDTNAQSSANAGLFDIGSNFLLRLNKEATWGTSAAQNANPNGGGAPAPAAPPRYRTWAEGYGLWSRTAAQDNFAGDTRRTYGGVAGIGMTPTPGLNLGVSVDHSHTRIDLPTVLQNARLDLTQIGGYISVERGPWTFSLAGTHGEGRIHSERDTGGGIATASYTGRIDGALAEVSYYHAMGQGRIVPKAAVEYTRSVTGALQEIGGVNPISAGAGVTERARLMIGAEVGRYFILNQHVLDISGYAKFIDNFHQRIGNVQVTPQFGLPVAVTGILESTTGADAGAAVSFNITNTTRVYAAYDGKFRTGFESHTGTLGIDVRW
jgi:uncharacterized protein with beta-barrel porin domain